MPAVCIERLYGNLRTQYPSSYRWDLKLYTGIIAHFRFPRRPGSYIEPVKELPDAAGLSRRRATELHRSYYQKLRLPRGNLQDVARSGRFACYTVISPDRALAGHTDGASSTAAANGTHVTSGRPYLGTLGAVSMIQTRQAVAITQPRVL